MSLTAFTAEKNFAVRQLTREGLNYEEAYINLGRLLYIGREAPSLTDSPVVDVIKQVLARKAYTDKKQCFFLYKKAAEVLTRIILRNPDRKLRHQALTVLQDVICYADGPVQKGAAEALGVLPLNVKGPSIDLTPDLELSHVSWRQVRELAGVASGAALKRIGRSFTAPTEDADRLCVIKCARASESAADLFMEACWMRYIGALKDRLKTDFHTPTPVPIKANDIFYLADPPPEIQSASDLHPQRLALCFIAHRHYFSYPNEAYGAGVLSNAALTDVLANNAFILGRLASMGIVHLAPIPLFHNRVQAGRRNDNGIYQWLRAGRLDRWLESCRYPNIGVTGVRDFEHFCAFDDYPRQLYLHIGTHILSLMLVAGSAFRYRDETRVGSDQNGVPADTRDLFAPDFFKALIESVFMNYYLGFVGQPYQGPAPRDLDALTQSLIDAMGVDRCMEEILRVHDQERMSDPEFDQFLKDRGASDDHIRTARRTAADIALPTGPHLGDFNGRISPPELIEFVSSAASLCVAGEFFRQRGLS